MSARRGTSRPADRPPLLGSRGLRRDRLGILGTLLPDPQLHRRLGKRQLELVVLQLQPPLISFHWRAQNCWPRGGADARTRTANRPITRSVHASSLPSDAENTELVYGGYGFPDLAQVRCWADAVAPWWSRVRVWSPLVAGPAAG